jgi:AsmA protein
MSRKIIYILGGLVALVLLAIVLLPFVVDANKYRPQIETAMNTALNRKVEIGNIKLSIFSGGVSVEDIAIADDPAFNSGPFLKAKALTVGVELMPLIFSRALHVTGITIEEPEVSLFRSHSGTWNFSTLGATESKPKEASSSTSSMSANVLVQRLTIKNGTLLVGTVGANGKRREYNNMNFEATGLSYTNQFPFQFSATTPGNGSLKLTGKAGPLNQTDAEETPLDASVEVKNLDLASTGFLDPASGIAGVLDFTGNLNSDGQKMNATGKITATKLQAVPGSSPAGVQVEIDYAANYILKAQTGDLTQGDVHIGKALAHLTGTYNNAGETPAIQMKLIGPGMPVPELEAVLPALGVILPSGTSLKGGTMDTSLAIAGPVDRTVITGPVKISNTTLSGFDLGSKLGALSSFAGIPKGSDTLIQTLSTDLRFAADGIRTDNLNLVVPSIGTMTGNGTIAPDHTLNYKMSALLTASSGPLGGVAKLTSLGGTQKGGIPFTIKGTTTNPSFTPDMGGMVGGMGKGALSGISKTVPGGQNLGGAVGGLFGKKKSQ